MHGSYLRQVHDLPVGGQPVHVYPATNPVLAAIGQHAITEVIADHQRTA